jgi:ribonuclease BN (tRNA processing enzyme)
LRVRFVGSGDAFGSGGRFQACIHVETAATRFLLDCGASSLIAMKRLGVSANDIDVVLLSHFHGDHFGGIPWLILEGQFFGRTKPLVIAGPPGVADRVREAMEAMYQGSSETRQRFEYSFVDLKAGVAAQLADLQVTPFEVPHSGGSTPFALRVESGGKVLAYSGDTEWTEALLDVARGADLFICEANFFERDVKVHLSYKTLATRRPDFECKRLILTHLGPEVLERRAQLTLEVADDGMVVDL